MKKLAAIALTAALLTGCSAQAAPEPAPTATTTMTFQECAKEAFDIIKEELGVKFLTEQKHKANAMVKETCKDYPMEGK